MLLPVAKGTTGYNRRNAAAATAVGKIAAASNPSGFASAKQKRQAREYARDRLDTEAKDGRYLRRKSIPILWDAPSGELLFGTTSVTALDRLITLFQQTFDRKFEMLGAGRQAFKYLGILERRVGRRSQRHAFFFLDGVNDCFKNFTVSGYPYNSAFFAGF